MSLTAALILAAGAAAATPAPPRGVELAEAKVTAVILPAAVVRQADGPVPAGRDAPQPRLSRRGATVLVEFQ